MRMMKFPNSFLVTVLRSIMYDWRKGLQIVLLEFCCRITGQHFCVQPKKDMQTFVWNFWNMVLILSIEIWYSTYMKCQIKFVLYASDATEFTEIISYVICQSMSVPMYVKLWLSDHI